MKKVWKAGISGLAALSLGAVGLMGVAAPAYAETVAPSNCPAQATDSFKCYTLTVSANTTDTTFVHNFNVYQIFTGSVNESETTDGYAAGTVLSNIRFGANGQRPADPTKLPQGLIDALAAAGQLTEGKDAWSTKVSDAKVATIVANFLTAEGGAYTDTTSSSTVATQKSLNDLMKLFLKDESAPYARVDAGASVSVQAGYYYLKDVTPGIDQGNNNAQQNTQALSTPIVQVVGPTTVTPKAETVTSQKKVDDVNDTTGDQGLLQDSADYDIGDTVPYTFTGVVAADYDAYENYYFLFADYQSAGLTFNSDSVQMSYKNTDGTTGTITGFDTLTGDAIAADKHAQKISTTGNGTPLTFVVKKDLKTVTGIKAGATITVKYNSTLNEDAVVGSDGNPNEMNLYFSNNPTDNDALNKTPLDKNIVFTYEVDVDKVDEDETTPLDGASFGLFKKVLVTAATNGVPAVYKWQMYATPSDDDSNVESRWVDWAGADPTTLDGVQWNAAWAAKKDAYASSSVEAVNKDGKYTAAFTGIDDGTYVLVETVTPDGYNTMDPKEFTVTADHPVESDAPAFGSLTMNYTNDAETNPDASVTGKVSTTVVNTKGSKLPSTGGMGTTLLYTVGGAIVLLAGAGLAVALRRRQA